jgi:hypothetical protein
MVASGASTVGVFRPLGLANSIFYCTVCRLSTVAFQALFRGSRGLAASQISRRRPLFMQLAIPLFRPCAASPGTGAPGRRFGEAFCRDCTVRKGCKSAARERLGAVFARVERLQRSGGERPHQRWDGEGRTLPTALRATLCEGAPIPWSGASGGSARITRTRRTRPHAAVHSKRTTSSD